MDNLAQFEEDFNSRTKKLVGSYQDRLSQTRPIPSSPNGDKKDLMKMNGIPLLF